MSNLCFQTTATQIVKWLLQEMSLIMESLSSCCILISTIYSLKFSVPWRLCCTTMIKSKRQVIAVLLPVIFIKKRYVYVCDKCLNSLAVFTPFALNILIWSQRFRYFCVNWNAIFKNLINHSLFIYQNDSSLTIYFDSRYYYQPLSLLIRTISS